MSFRDDQSAVVQIWTVVVLARSGGLPILRSFLVFSGISFPDVSLGYFVTLTPGKVGLDISIIPL